ncbi:MAG: alpha/beta hydrolase [Azospirillaceae bacterium]
MLTLDRRFTFEGHEVAWGVLGDGPPIVLVHGFPWSAQAWRRIAPWLARRRRVFFHDLLGSGLSAKADDVSPRVQNRLLAALLDHWGLDRPHVVGHDFGGLAALRGRFVDGLDYGRLTLFDAVGVLPSGSPFFAHVREHEAAFAALPEFAHEALFRAYIAQAAAAPLSPEAEAIYAEPWRGPDGQAAFYRWIAQSETDAIGELAELYRPLDCPVRLVWGERDTFIPPAQGRELAVALGLDDVTIVPGAGHAIQEDAPEAVVAMLEET